MSSDLWEAVYRAPDDDSPRRVLADALLAAGDPLGELIHLQLQPALDPKATARVNTLLSDPKLGAQFFSAPAHLAFERGLPAALGCEAAVFLSADVPRGLTRIELSDMHPSELQSVLDKLRRLQPRAVRLGGLQTALWPEHAPELIDLPGLHHLGLFNIARPGDRIVRFAASPYLQRRRSLELGYGLGPVLNDVLAVLPPLKQLALYEWPRDAGALLSRHDALLLRGPTGSGAAPPFRGVQVGRWKAELLLGAREGLDASLARDSAGTAGLLLRTDWLSGVEWTPREWFKLTPGTLQVIDRGVDSTGEWCVFELTKGVPITMTRVPPCAWAPMTRRLAAGRSSKAHPLRCLFAAPHGLDVQPFAEELDPYRVSRRLHGGRLSRDTILAFCPEVARGQPRTTFSTSWDVAIQLVMGLGLDPFPQGTELEVLEFVVKGPPIRLAALQEPLRSILERCLQRDPQRRAGLDQLAAVLETLPEEPMGAIPPLPETQRALLQAAPWLESVSVHDKEPLT